MYKKRQELKERLDENQAFISAVEHARNNSLVLSDETYNKYTDALEEQKRILIELEELSENKNGFFTHAQLHRKDSEIVIDECKVEVVVELNNSEYHSFRNNLFDNYDFIIENIDSMYHDNNGVSHCLLVLGEGEKDGVLVESEGSHYARYTAFLPNARDYMQKQIQTMAEELIREGTAHSENGSWVVGFDEISQHFDTTITGQNELGKMLIEELKTRDEVSEIIATEDCLEMNYYFDNAPQTHDSGDKLMTLFSLMGCNLSDVHIVHNEEEHDLATIVELNQNTLTDEGKVEWSDVLNAKVIGIYNGYYGTQISVKDVAPERLEAFSKMLSGDCDINEFNRWVNDSGEEKIDIKMD